MKLINSHKIAHLSLNIDQVACVNPGEWNFKLNIPCLLVKKWTRFLIADMHPLWILGCYFISVEILRSFSSLVRSLQIRHFYPIGADTSRKYLFGVYDADWSSIILEMFSNKMDKLSIVNPHFPNYLSRECVEILRKVSFCFHHDSFQKWTFKKSWIYNILPILFERSLQNFSPYFRNCLSLERKYCFRPLVLRIRKDSIIPIIFTSFKVIFIIFGAWKNKIQYSRQT